MLRALEVGLIDEDEIECDEIYNDIVCAFTEWIIIRCNYYGSK
jgi:hypothetical protein